MGFSQSGDEPLIWTVELTPQARLMLEAIKDRRTLDKIRERIDGLAREPRKQGKSLMGELSGFYSLRAAGQRYRIIYTLQEDKIVVLVVATGIREAGDKADIYTLTQKLLRLGLLEGEPATEQVAEDQAPESQVSWETSEPDDSL